MRKGAHTRWECRYHLVWCPKYRKDLFENEWLRQYAWELFEKIAIEYGMNIEEKEIASDHLHMLIEISPKVVVSDAVKVLKSISAREIFKKFPSVRKRLWAGELWREGYFVRSAGDDVTGEMVRRYIEAHDDKSVSPAQLRLKLKAEPKRAPDSPGLDPG